MKAGPDGHEALDELYWRAEILQAMYWMRGEGLADEVSPARLAEFLVADAGAVDQQMRRLAADGYLSLVQRVDQSPSPRPAPNLHYRLTALGAAEGGRGFRDEFEGLTRPGHGECAPGCWCKDPKYAGDPCPSLPRETHH